MPRFCFLMLLLIPLVTSVACGQSERKSAGNADAAAKYLDSGKALHAKGGYHGAIADYTKAIELDPKFGSDGMLPLELS